jgi:hypothetical protein
MGGGAMLYSITYEVKIGPMLFRWIGAMTLDLSEANRAALAFVNRGDNGVAIERRDYLI